MLAFVLNEVTIARTDTSKCHDWLLVYAGLFMAVLTAVTGPITEVFLINKLGLYHYSHPNVWGVPTWIPWVYFCGSPAVGNLGRKVTAVLESQATMRR